MVATPLYREDAYLTDCAATVTGLTEDGALLLDRTVFYPAGGGQPGDSGTLEWEGGACPIAPARKAGEDVAHPPAEGATPPPVGAAVTARIDAAARDGHRRAHTALHLLSVVIPAPVTGGQIGVAKGRLDFDLAEPPEDPAALEAALNAMIAADHPVGESWITDAELAANPGLVKTMAVKPPMGSGRVRLVRIGDPSAPVDLQPCGGTHVRSTGEIGPVRLGKIEKKGKRNRRVTIHLQEPG
jgi:misacylated tRNA(Ala) deacylase